MKYEYKVWTPELKGWLKKKINSDQLSEQLNELGAEGWELVAVVTTDENWGSMNHTTDKIIDHFKRAIA